MRKSLHIGLFVLVALGVMVLTLGPLFGNVAPQAVRAEESSLGQIADQESLAWSGGDLGGSDEQGQTGSVGLFAPLAQGPVQVQCGYPAISGWTVVSDFIKWSDCVDWDCWTRWIYYDPSHALMEKDGSRMYLPNDVYAPYPYAAHGYIYDPRDRCGDDSLAAGWWYHNGHAKPYWRYVSLPGDPPFLMCEWILDSMSRHSSSFGEEDSCPPTCGLDPRATPPVTVCEDPPPIYDPVNTPVPPTPVRLDPPDVEPKAYVRSSQIGNGAWYAVSQNFFYWPFGHYMNIRFSARIEDPHSGCAASSEVTRYMFLGVNERVVCDYESGNPPVPAQTDCKDPSGNCCAWHTPEQAVHVLFTQNEEPSPHEQQDSLQFWGTEPGAYTLRYVVEVVTNYYCAGEASYRELVWYFPLNLRVYLTQSVQGR